MKARFFGENTDIGDVTNLLDNDTLSEQPISLAITVSEGKYYMTVSRKTVFAWMLVILMFLITALQ